jgi:hypothetical protein
VRYEASLHGESTISGFETHVSRQHRTVSSATRPMFATYLEKETRRFLDSFHRGETNVRPKCNKQAAIVINLGETNLVVRGVSSSCSGRKVSLDVYYSSSYSLLYPGIIPGVSARQQMHTAWVHTGTHLVVHGIFSANLAPI